MGLEEEQERRQVKEEEWGEGEEIKMTLGCYEAHFGLIILISH